jgi:hypothetical protein
VAQLDEETLATYLNDHLAGSVAALQLMDRICAAHGDGPIGLLMTRLRADVAFEQTQVRQLLTALSAKESQVRRAVAWIGEQFLRFKIGAGERDDSGLMLFEALEALSMGFFGRMSLWRILSVVRDDLPLALDFDALATRASRHLADLEEARLAAGLAALSSREKASI